MSQSLWLDSKRLELVMFVYFVSTKTEQTRKEDTRNYFSLYFVLVILHSLSNQAWGDLATAYLNTVLDKSILSQRFGEHISDLIMGVMGYILIMPSLTYSRK